MNIWILALDDEARLPPDLLQRAGACLSAEESARAARFQFAADRNRFVLAHALCRHMLSEFGGLAANDWQFAREQHGRPYVTNAGISLDFNLSHTRGMVGCALSESVRVGFDLECRQRRANIEALAHKQFAPAEARHVLSLSGEAQKREFFHYWTLKEAYIKLTGRGLSEALDSFQFDLGAQRPRCHARGRALEQYQFGLVDVGSQHQAAWACERSGGNSDEPHIRYLGLPDLEAMSG